MRFSQTSKATKSTSDAAHASTTSWALDLGNTRLKIGRIEAGELAEVHVWSRGQMPEALQWLPLQASSGYIIMSGHPQDEALWRAALEPLAPVYAYRFGDKLPIRLGYRSPEMLGVDRLAAVIGAHKLFPGRDCMVVSAGTCITIEHLRADGFYLGGSISPGISMRLRAMHTFTGRLPNLPAVLPKGASIGTDTSSAMQLGAIRGAVHELMGWWKEALQTLPADAPLSNLSTKGHEAHIQLVVCGGDAPLLRPLLPGATAVRPHLVLEGLAQLHAYALSV